MLPPTELDVVVVSDDDVVFDVEDGVVSVVGDEVVVVRVVV
jgi:hypothetical protein